MDDEISCAFCLADDDDRIYLTSDDGEVSICGFCASKFAVDVYKRQQEKGETENSESLEDNANSGDVITSDMVYSWMNGESDHEFDFHKDAKLIVNNKDTSELLSTVNCYVNYLAEKSGQHEDYVRDRCDKLPDENSIFKDYFVSAYKYCNDPEMDDAEAEEAITSYGVTFDDLISYFMSSDVDQQTRLNFTYSFLACLAGDNKYAPPSVTNLDLLQNKMIQAFQNIAAD